jgi:proteasome lid subunit RPN8/RPN11
MTLRLAAPALAAIQAHARRAYPDECCGALLGSASMANAADRRVMGAVALENEATGARGRRFLISSPRFRACERAGARLGLDVVGFYHSHPDAPPVPSTVDRALAWPWYCWLIAGVRRDGLGPIRAWMLRDDRGDFLEMHLSIAEPAPCRQ